MISLCRVSAMRLSSSIALLLIIVFFAGNQSIASDGFEIVGLGTNPPAALRDATRQIAELFGGVEVLSESEVNDFVLKYDRIKTKSHFTGSKLDRFFRGFEHRDGLWYAYFTFPAGFVQAVQSRPRDTGSAKFSVDWEAISYQSQHADSFGEVKAKSYSVEIPPWYRSLIDSHVVKTDNIGPVAGTLLGLALVFSLLTITYFAWRDSKREARSGTLRM